MTILLEIAVVAAIVFGAVAYVLGQFDSMRPAPPESGAVGIPDGPVEPAAIDRARFGLSFRGYRMDEVDAVLDRLREELTRRDGETAPGSGDAAAPNGPEDGVTTVPHHVPGADEAPSGDTDGLEEPWPS